MEHTRILPELLLGECPAQAEDVAELRRMGATAVLNLQTDDDMPYEKVDWAALEAAYRTAALEVVRVPVRDYSSEDLCSKLPACVDALDRLLNGGHTVYLHCSAGINRSPTVAVAYLHRCKGWNLPRAAEFVSRQHPCSSNLGAIQDAAWPPTTRAS